MQTPRKEKKKMMLKAIISNRRIGLKKGKKYKLIEEEVEGLKVKVNGKELWFRNYYFEKSKR